MRKREFSIFLRVGKFSFGVLMPQLRRHLSKVFYICDGAPAKIYENRFWADFLLLFMGYLLGEKLAEN